MFLKSYSHTLNHNKEILQTELLQTKILTIEFYSFYCSFFLYPSRPLSYIHIILGTRFNVPNYSLNTTIGCNPYIYQEFQTIFLLFSFSHLLRSHSHNHSHNHISYHSHNHISYHHHTHNYSSVYSYQYY